MATSHVYTALAMVMILMCLGCSDAEHTDHHHHHMGKEKVTHLQFYMHDIVLGKNATAVKVAPGNSSDFSASAVEGSLFGSVFVIDDPLSETPDRNSKLVGRAQGLYALSSQGEVSLLMALTYSMESGKFKGSTLSVVGKNMVFQKQREMPIVGGSGRFRMARGYAFAQTHSSQGPDAIIGYNVTVFHY
eukprot:Gb_27541 [translate_table: standard]